MSDNPITLEAITEASSNAAALPSLIGGRRVARKSFVGNETEVV